MNFPVKMEFPLDDGGVVKDLAQTPEGRVHVTKTISAHSREELEKLQEIGWKVQR